MALNMMGRKVLDEPRGELDVASLGEEKLILFEKSEKTGWIAALTVNKNVAFAGARDLGQLIILLSVGVVVILLGGLWAILSLNVIKPVNSLVASAGEIAKGHLDTALDVNRKDEIGTLQQSIALMVGSLKQNIQDAHEKGLKAEQEAQRAQQATADAVEAQGRAETAKAEGMLQAAQQLESVVEVVTAASEDLSTQIGHSSHGAGEQAQRVDETATAMEEMNATVLEVAKNASRAAETADKAKRKAQDGSHIVEQVVTGVGEVQTQALELKTDMTALGEQAEGIGQILNVISDIADQTNLLALNAAIEAARAGDAGRGFAVVADEVRKLAEKTMTATKHVGEAIHGIQAGTRKNIESVEQAVKKINAATDLASQSGAALGEIVMLVDLTTDQVRSIATASEQQSSASDEITRSIEDINRITAETSSAMKQSAQAVDELAGQAQELRNLLDHLAGEGVGTEHRTPRALPKRVKSLSQ